MKLAAIKYDSSGGAVVDEVLADVARVLKSSGVTVAGAIQWNEPVPDRRRCRDDVRGSCVRSRRILVSEDRGSHARGCHLDTSALEEAAVLAASSIEPGVDLVVINRFGKQEAEGRGFRQAIEGAILLERPVLVGVSETNRGSWETFTGSEAEYLPCSIDAVLAWYGGVRPDAA